MAGFDLGDYVTVPERVAQFYEQHPEGRIISDIPRIVEIGDRTFIEVTTRAYRSPDDPVPCQGSAWEPFPGRTPYTKDSEMMNAESSAIGRALAAAGIAVKRSIASANEIRARQQQDEPTVRRSPKQVRISPAEAQRRAGADAAIMAAVERLNDLPDDQRAKAKSRFVERFGAPSELAGHMIEQVEEFVSEAEALAGR